MTGDAVQQVQGGWGGPPPLWLGPAAVALDWVIGDPRWLPHPVVAMGRLIAAWERRLWSPRPPVAWLSGLALTAGLVTAAAGAAAWLLAILPAPASAAAALLLGMQALAARGLHDEAAAVLERLDAGDLEGAQRQVARIVGRDVHRLDTQGVLRATAESVAESVSDGIVAPLAYLVLGGVPAALAYKAVNTLDSMVGHRDGRYEWFGKVAARLDDAANWLPARLTALALAAGAATVGLDGRRALACALRQGRRHPSPNAGYPEAAAAGALHARLGGPAAYGGEVVDKPWLDGGDRPLTTAGVRRLLRAAAVAEGLALGVLVGLVALLR